LLSHAGFQVRKKTFAYFLNDHHGGGIISGACKALPGENTALAAAQPDRFYLPAYIGPKGWATLRLDIGNVDWEEVAEPVTAKLPPDRTQAPRSLVAGTGRVQ
jgi:hypothetical protein